MSSCADCLFLIWLKVSVVALSDRHPGRRQHRPRTSHHDQRRAAPDAHTRGKKNKKDSEMFFVSPQTTPVFMRRCHWSMSDKKKRELLLFSFSFCYTAASTSCTYKGALSLLFTSACLRFTVAFRGQPQVTTAQDDARGTLCVVCVSQRVDTRPNVPLRWQVFVLSKLTRGRFEGFQRKYLT